MTWGGWLRPRFNLRSVILGDADNTSPAGHRLTVESDTGAAPAILSRPVPVKPNMGINQWLYTVSTVLQNSGQNDPHRAQGTLPPSY